MDKIDGPKKKHWLGELIFILLSVYVCVCVNEEKGLEMKGRMRVGEMWKNCCNATLRMHRRDVERKRGRVGL